jgi:hypothetical protein
VTGRRSATAPAAHRPPGALIRPELWQYVSRLVPWALIATSLLLGAAWAIRTHLDVANERSVLAVISTLALCAVFDDEAAALTAATPTPLWGRWLPRATVPIVVLGLAWAVVVAAVAARRTGPMETAPWWAMTLEWVAVATSQLAVAAVGARRPGTTGSIAPGLLIALIWLTAESAPIVHSQLHPVQAHAALWCVLLSTSSTVLVVAARERPWRHRSATAATGKVESHSARPDLERLDAHHTDVPLGSRDFRV